MTLEDSITAIYGHGNWINPLHPYMFRQDLLLTPYEAYKDLKPEYQKIVINLFGREPKEGDE